MIQGVGCIVVSRRGCFSSLYNDRPPPNISATRSSTVQDTQNDPPSTEAGFASVPELLNPEKSLNPNHELLRGSESPAPTTTQEAVAGELFWPFLAIFRFLGLLFCLYWGSR